jgi:ferredoxin
MAKVVQKREECIGCAACVAVCPKYFEMADDGRSRLKGGKQQGKDVVLETDDVVTIKLAADVCPVNIIHIDAGTLPKKEKR